MMYCFVSSLPGLSSFTPVHHVHSLWISQKILLTTLPENELQGSEASFTLSATKSFLDAFHEKWREKEHMMYLT